MAAANLWDIFCKAVDNYGDIGVCWRLAADLASRGHRVRLWIDQPAALAWMAPGALEGRWPQVQVLAWDRVHDGSMLAGLAPADVWVEGFGCETPVELQQQRFDPARSNRQDAGRPPVWINLEYLSAEGFSERTHGLPAPLMVGPGSGQTRFFFYPGFSARTGGLLREPDVAAQLASFDRTSWLARHGIAWRGERLVCLFCYEPLVLASLLGQLRQDPKPTRLLVTHGRATAVVKRVLEDRQTHLQANAHGRPEPLSLSFLPPLTQTDFDRLLWSCDLNFVRGEDSLVRAIWAGKPLVWQIYPQHDEAHRAKLLAFLDAMDAPQSWRDFHFAWNGLAEDALPQPDMALWSHAVLQARERLTHQSDLTTRLLEFVATLQRKPHFGMEKR